MTASDFAALLLARRIGQGKWQGRCPAHADRSPSLSVAEGHDGRVLVNCFAGCTLAQILGAVQLTSRDLFAGPPPTYEQATALRARREANERTTRMQREMRREAWVRVRKWQAIVDLLGAKLARTPEDLALGTTFHEACDRLHELEIKAEQREIPVRNEWTDSGKLHG